MSSKYDMSDDVSDSDTSHDEKLALTLELELIHRDNKKFDHEKSKIDFYLKIIQLVIINIIFLGIIGLSIWYINKLIEISPQQPHALYILGPFALGFVLSMLYICGSTIKGIFGFSEKEKNNHIVSTLELISKAKNTTDFK